jgi:hypothetical protein
MSIPGLSLCFRLAAAVGFITHAPHLELALCPHELLRYSENGKTIRGTTSFSSPRQFENEA